MSRPRACVEELPKPHGKVVKKSRGLLNAMLHNFSGAMNGLKRGRMMIGVIFWVTLSASMLRIGSEYPEWR